MKIPYLGLGLCLVLLAVTIWKFKLPAFNSAGDQSHDATGSEKSIWRHSRLVLGAIGIFVYVGAEVSIGSFHDQLSEPTGNWKHVLADGRAACIALLGRRDDWAV